MANQQEHADAHHADHAHIDKSALLQACPMPFIFACDVAFDGSTDRSMQLPIMLLLKCSTKKTESSTTEKSKHLQGHTGVFVFSPYLIILPML